MTGVNLDWVVNQLDIFIELTKGHWEGNPEDVGVWWVVEGDEDSIKLQLPVVERILDRYLPGWQKEDLSYDREDPQEQVWAKHRNLALRVRGIVDREDEVRKNLGDDAPELSAANLHPWVWDGASSLWQSEHFREAVEGAIRKLNAETQNKLGRRDVSETDLFNQAFSEQAPAAGKPRLYRMKNDGSSTFKSVQRGARTFAEGVFAGIRNPLAHEADQEMPEQQALEYLAALSVLARWVDESTLEFAS
ncbi:MAG: restriction endonuclease [Microbacterium sp.]|nr:restriction endonuclease [Microbacterium sp.]|tara:strand:- start:403 stop:1146 length:744 start_codon:yes stop_codon:yes gene_type:complete